jgi:hypothetical protein
MSTIATKFFLLPARKVYGELFITRHIYTKRSHLKEKKDLNSMDGQGKNYIKDVLKE